MLEKEGKMKDGLIFWLKNNILLKLIILKINKNFISDDIFKTILIRLSVRI